MAKKIQESSTFDKTAQEMVGTVDYLADITWRYPQQNSVQSTSVLCHPTRNVGGVFPTVSRSAFLQPQVDDCLICLIQYLQKRVNTKTNFII